MFGCGNRSLLREFQTFLAVCRWGTFTAAAQRLGMTQSAVSDHIQRLEEFTGVQLFHRTGRSATLNAAGEALRPLAEEALQITDRMRTGHGAGQLRGSLRVGAITSVHNSLMARGLVAYAADDARRIAGRHDPPHPPRRRDGRRRRAR